MKKLFISLICLLLIASSASAKSKNVIVMIPDGTSTGMLSVARWYQIYHNQNDQYLAIDPYVCGLVKTYSSNAPIGDSAPTTSCYMTGMTAPAGWVSMYPVKTANDLIEVDPQRSYQPLATALELAKSMGKSTGLVSTSEFPHATPADCASHFYSRRRYDVLAKQMAHNDLDVVIGGGVGILQQYALDSALRAQDYDLYLNDKQGMLETESGKFWALFNDRALPYEIDRDASRYPSLTEMATSAIEGLSKNKKGFFLMIEGSMVDWAGHGNDAKTGILEFLAFDQAVEAVLEFAKRNGNTTVVILPDHGNSGISMGGRVGSYSSDPLETYFSFMDDYKVSISTFESMIKTKKDIAPKMLECFGVELTNAQVNDLWLYKTGEHPTKKFSRSISEILYSESRIGFTTWGHTSEDVFLAVYSPDKKVPTGVLLNTEVNDYLCTVLGSSAQKLGRLTRDIYVPHTKLFDEKEVTISHLADNKYVLSLAVNGKKLSVESYTNYAMWGEKRISLNSVVVFVDKNSTFYLPKELIAALK